MEEECKTVEEERCEAEKQMECQTVEKQACTTMREQVDYCYFTIQIDVLLTGLFAIFRDHL